MFEWRTSWAWDVICAATYQGMLEECGSIHWVCLTIKRGALHDFQKFWTNLMQFETFLVEREISSINHQFSRAANAVVPKYCSTSPSVLVWSIQRCKTLTVDRQFEQLNDSIWRQGWLLSREVLQALHCFCVRIRQASHFLWVALVGMVPICSRSLRLFDIWSWPVLLDPRIAVGLLGTVLVIHNFVLHAWQADWAAFAGPWQTRLAVEWTFLDSESDHRRGDRQTWSNFKTDGLNAWRNMKKHHSGGGACNSTNLYSLIYGLKLECVHRRSHLNGYSVLIQADFSAGCQDRLAFWLMDCFRRTCELFLLVSESRTSRGWAGPHQLVGFSNSFRLYHLDWWCRLKSFHLQISQSWPEETECTTSRKRM